MNEIEIVGVDSYDGNDRYRFGEFDTSRIGEDEGRIVIKTTYEGHPYTCIDLFQLVDWIDDHRELIADLKKRSK